MICNCVFAIMASFTLNSKLLTLKSNQNATKLCTRLFLHKINKNMPWKDRWSFGLRSPLIEGFSQIDKTLTISIFSNSQQMAENFQKLFPFFASKVH